MAESKILLIAKLDAAREGLSRSGALLRDDLDVPRHIKTAFGTTFGRHKKAWIGGAAALGWVLSRWPGRRRHQAQHDGVHAHDGRVGRVGRSDRAGNEMAARKYALGGILLAILRTALSALKPALTAIATRKLKDIAVERIRW